MVGRAFFSVGITTRFTRISISEVISMKHTYKVLKSDLELFAAALSQARVYMVQPLNEGLIDIVDYSGEYYTGVG